MIGPTFFDELQAAGVAELPFTWNIYDGTVDLSDPRLTKEQKEAILLVKQNHDPAKTKPDPKQIKRDKLATVSTITGLKQFIQDEILS